MGEKHTVRFEPVGIEIEADEDETVLEAAFRQGVMLMHGCKEGQCSACKSFMLEGEEGTEFELARYSTFALNDFEKEEGYTLLCRTHAYDDLVVELINYDEDMIRSGLPIVEAVAEVVANEPVTHDMRHLVLRVTDPPELRFVPGQYVDVFVPGRNAKRAFSMANIPVAGNDRLEFVIKIYPDGLFSHHLDTKIQPGDSLRIKGPYGMFTLREGRESDLLFIGGGAGMAPILSLLRSMAARGIGRKATYYYGARDRRDLCFTGELEALQRQLPGFRYVPALSEPSGETAWDGPVGLVTDVVDEREGDLAGVDAYLCGPPPMVEAAIPMLVRHGVAEDHIYYDKFTTTGDPDEE
jgi:propane monooxygenase reductase subunit